MNEQEKDVEVVVENNVAKVTETVTVESKFQFTAEDVRQQISQLEEKIEALTADKLEKQNLLNQILGV